ncbi:pleiotropic drug resistance protein 3-like [Gossypium australe]|uniref:Pleiotropic drug resistance protein 3-like n=1 Tax=Gossypium australe TaxID=47621 RepID=A0A5B6WK17_9ROSI|nr:pleiotropic drug resistance protein 3-like [Gossypium australe]
MEKVCKPLNSICRLKQLRDITFRRSRCSHIGQLLEKNYNIVFKNCGCIIFDLLGQEVITILMKNRIFVLDWNLHKRLRHTNYKSLSRMREAGLVKETISIDEHRGVCEVCQLEKHARPMKTPSLNGCRNFFLFIDDCTKYCWVYFLKQKFDVVEVFWKFKVQVENRIDCKLKKVMYDNEKLSTHSKTIVKQLGSIPTHQHLHSTAEWSVQEEK